MATLVIAEHDHADLSVASRCAISAASRLAQDVHVLVAGHRCTAVADAATDVAGVGVVRLVDAPHYADQTAENLSALIASMAAGYTHILAAGTTFGKNLLPRVAALLDVAQISDVIDIEAPDTFVRPIYAGNIVATVTSTDAVKVLTVRTTAFNAAATGNSAPVEAVDAGPDLGLVRLQGRELTRNERPELGSARVVVAGGRGLGSHAAFHELLDPLADRLEAALGATRAAVDAGYVPNDFQVGQTGKIVAPDLYIAVGISGAIQHLAGMSDSKVIVAINKDAEAPIFQIADYGLVGDLFDLVPRLTAALTP